jgi:hypothetical protein
MSDSQKFGGGPSVEVAEQAPIPTEIESPSKFSPKLVLVAGAVIVVLAVAAYFLLFSGGGDAPSSSGLVTPGPKVSTAPKTPVASKAPKTAPAVAGNGLSSGGRDPFVPLVVAANPSASTSASSTATAPAGGTTTPAGVKSTLLVNSVNAAANSASVTVDGKPYIAYAGQLFAKYYTLKVVITGANQCAVFNFGDLPAQLCKGQQATFTG